MNNLKTAYSGSDIAQIPTIQSLLTTSGTQITDLGSSLVNKLGGVVVTTASIGYPGCDTADITLANGQVWAACNVGAVNAYVGQPIVIASVAQQLYTGYLYQWGRNKDITIAATTITGPVSTDLTSSFILSSGDWLITPNNNLWGGATTSASAGTFATATSGDKILMKGVCATGYHIPTDREWLDTRSILSNNWNTIISTLKLPLAGYRRGSTA